jgi:hypothetical protein
MDVGPGGCHRARAPAGAGGAGAHDVVGISGCVIARNEEARIASCLESLRPHVDEIVLVDTGSTDRTPEIAHELGARVYTYRWCDDFSSARNQSLDLARGKWIFWMDADDVISEESGRLLRELAARHPDCDVAFQAQVRIPPGPGEYSNSVVDHVKLFPNRADVRFEHRIHEQILPSLRRAGIEVAMSDIVVTHEHYDRSPEGQAAKRRRDSRLLRLDLRDRPDHPFVLFNFGMTHLYATHDYELAAHYLRRSIERSNWSDSIVRKAYALLTSARMSQQDWDLAVSALEEGRVYYPDDAELLYLAGQVYQELGQLDRARGALERLVSGSDRPHFQSVGTGLRTYVGKTELARLFRRMGAVTEASRLLDEVVARWPDYLPARRELDATQETAVGGAPPLAPRVA